MFTQQLAPVAGSLTASALIALLPLITIFILLGVFRIRAHWAGLASLAVAVIVAITAFKMPVGLALLSGTEGAVFGLFPIMWIVFNALWVYQLTVVSGRFADLRAAFNLISADPRIMAVLIAFCFGGLLEALAGFGAPVAITGVMLMAIGFSAFRAAAIVLLANTAPVAFGAIATPILTAAALTNIPASEIGAVVGRQTPVLALFVPLILVALVDGRRGLRQTWPAALVCGVSFALAQFVSSNFISVELTDIIASLVAVGATMAFLRVWQPSGTEEALSDLQAATAEAEDVPGGGGVTPAGRAGGRSDTAGGPDRAGGRSGGSAVATPAASSRELTAGRIMMALLPYIIVIAVFSIAKLLGPVKTFLAGTDLKIEWPGLHGNVLSTAGKPISSTIYNFQWLSSPGSLLVLCGILVAICYRISPAGAVREYFTTAYKLRWAFLTVAAVLALAYVMNQSGQTLTIGNWIAATGAFFAFLSPILGWLGTAVTGSDTSANALFSTLQQAAGERAGLDPTLLVAANTSGGVVGKMISPQNLTIAATAVGIPGREGDLFRYLIRWSLGMILFMCVLVYLQSTPVLGWMI
ncbi:MAG: lactate permease [Mycobacterium sp.]|jgi:lactate permease|nr:lactate permease [Mycobacterium sp.]